MPHTFISCYYHCIFSTKERAPVLTQNIQYELYPYFGGIAQRHRIGLLVVGGMSDHVHLLFSMPTTMSISEAMKLFKGSSSRWIHEKFPDLQEFAWQEGYGAFTVSRSILDRTIAYINNQAEHHQNMTSEDEFLLLLRKHDINK
ncbi:transposase [candidate division LCP-89 bacterium B3_LCP]|uniref:Transposase n=1 Tax=candidate division LCP-89 bacterium B3_LCP TaxID=2012998 RepID=A0A532USN3_UNCL8|nr:MAG: transposase [candidate division LCP-89 bacterium B3_LCP]